MTPKRERQKKLVAIIVKDEKEARVRISRQHITSCDTALREIKYLAD